MGIFDGLNNDGMEDSKDTLGGYSARDSDIYTGKIKMAYAGKSAGGARSVTVILADGDFGATEYRETIYVTNKKGENFYKTQAGGDKKFQLPGFITIDQLCQVTVGTSLSEQNTEDKMVKIYDYDAGGEVPKSVPVLIDLIGQEVSVAILNTLENQTVKQGDTYVPKDDGSTKNTNSIDKVFNTQHKMTVSEAKAGATTGEFWDAWLAKNKGQVRDKVVKADGQGGNAGKPGSGGAPTSGGNSGGGAPRSSLFGGK